MRPQQVLLLVSSALVGILRAPPVLERLSQDCWRTAETSVEEMRGQELNQKWVEWERKVKVWEKLSLLALLEGALTLWRRGWALQKWVVEASLVKRLVMQEKEMWLLALAEHEQMLPAPPHAAIEAARQPQHHLAMMMMKQYLKKLWPPEEAQTLQQPQPPRQMDSAWPSVVLLLLHHLEKLGDYVAPSLVPQTGRRRRELAAPNQRQQPQQQNLPRRFQMKLVQNSRLLMLRQSATFLEVVKLPLLVWMGMHLSCHQKQLPRQETLKAQPSNQHLPQQGARWDLLETARTAQQVLAAAMRRESGSMAESPLEVGRLRWAYIIQMLLPH